MKAQVLAPLVFGFLLAAGLSQDPFLDDALIKRQFREQALAQLEARDSGSLTAFEVRRELKKEKTEPVERRKPAPEDGSPPLSAAELYEEVKQSTLIVGHLYREEGRGDWLTNLAGGVILSADGLAITNYHVLQFEKAEIFGAMTCDGRFFTISEVLASNRRDDLAVFRLAAASDLRPAFVASTAGIGDSIALVSHPDSHFFTLTTGRISRFSIDPSNRAPRLEITAGFARGSSGSGIFNDHGQLVGLAAATNAVYYEEGSEPKRNLQMVIHSGVPLTSIKKLIGETP